MAPNYPEFLERLAVALALGLMIGLERGWQLRDLPEGQRVAGLRTFGLIGLLGGISALVNGPARGLFMIAVVAVLGALLAAGYWYEAQRAEDLSITSAVAAVVAFSLGVLAGEGELTIAAAAAVVATALLGFKPELHGLLQKIRREELLATLRLLLITIVLLPVLPNKGFGPWQAFNPYEIWWMVVLIAAISYVGYFIGRAFGPERGVLLTGLMGGMVSSTVVAITFARRPRLSEDGDELVAAAIVAASATMFPRMLVIVALTAPILIRRLLWPLLAATIIPFAAAAWYAMRAGRNADGETLKELEPQNPLDLWFAVKFGVALAAVMILSRAAAELIGIRGLYMLAGLSGLVDVDAITLSIASMLREGQAAANVASVAILITAAVNTVIKAVIVSVMRGGRTAGMVWLPLVAALAIGGILFGLVVF